MREREKERDEGRKKEGEGWMDGWGAGEEAVMTLHGEVIPMTSSSGPKPGEPAVFQPLSYSFVVCVCKSVWLTHIHIPSLSKMLE